MEDGSTRDPLLAEQLAYYRARADEYDQWFFRQGRSDRGPELNRRWFAEIAEVECALDACCPRGRILELACGTGLWTRHLVRSSNDVTAVDASPEMIAQNRTRLPDSQVRYIQADLFDWQPDSEFDFVFIGFWLSHVPPERFEPFWELVRRCLAPAGRMFFVDSLYEPTSSAHDHRLEGPEATTLKRRLNDGREFRIYKIFHRPEELAARLRALGWNVSVRSTATYFFHGTAE